jgi:hypothetical protein
MKASLAIITVAAALALAGCKQHGAAAGPGDAPAEILPGSASDAMIAYDTLRSQPPLAPPTGEVGPGGSATRAKAKDATDAAAEPSNAAAPPPAAAETAAPPPG